MAEQRLTFEKWLIKLQAHFTKHGWGSSYVEICSRECWRASYDAGDEPFEAFEGKVLSGQHGVKIEGS